MAIPHPQLSWEHDSLRSQTPSPHFSASTINDRLCYDSKTAHHIRNPVYDSTVSPVRCCIHHHNVEIGLGTAHSSASGPIFKHFGQMVLLTSGICLRRTMPVSSKVPLTVNYPPCQQICPARIDNFNGRRCVRILKKRARL